MKKFLTIIVLLLSLAACDDGPKETSPTPTEPKVEVVDLRKEINKIVKESPSCSRSYWKERGYAPMSYMNGVALMYAKQVCGQGSDFIKPSKINSTFKFSWENKTRSHLDALAHYGIEGSELNTYTFLLGLGMRESSGQYCEGRDRSAGFTKHDSAEAGLYQMSWNARLFNTELKPLYDKYKSGELKCELDVFKQGVSCSSYDAINHGSGSGVAWQELMKRCPAAAAQWGAIMIRSYYKHFGPIIRKEVEFKAECKDMLEKVEELAKKECSQL